MPIEVNVKCDGEFCLSTRRLDSELQWWQSETDTLAGSCVPQRLIIWPLVKDPPIDSKNKFYCGERCAVSALRNWMDKNDPSNKPEEPPAPEIVEANGGDSTQRPPASVPSNAMERLQRQGVGKPLLKDLPQTTSGLTEDFRETQDERNEESLDRR